MREINENLATIFKVTDDDRKELLASGRDFIFRNRVGWASTYLRKAGLLESPRRGSIIITELGLKILKQNPDKINVAFLRRFPEFLEFQNTKHAQFEMEHNIPIPMASFETPEETLDFAYQGLRGSLANELLNRVMKLPPSFFERMVVELLVKMGYGGSIKDAGKAIGKTGDEGIDGTIKEDKLGLDIIYVQAKRWKPGNQVGRPRYRSLLARLLGKELRRAYL